MKFNLTIMGILACWLVDRQAVLAQNLPTIVYGTVLESNGQKPVEYATVVILDKDSEKPIKGVTTGATGGFELPVNSTNFNVEIRFIGFNTLTIDDIQIVDNKANLGTILLSENSETLEEVVVRGEKSTMEFKLDKRVFNVGKDLSSTGASALEVLNNVPSVNVNIEGQISLRGSSGVQILINGKPSVLASEQGNALGSITAEMIDRIEVITNPSAKYDAEGTSGIINIVIKKEERKGANGSFSINTGTPHNHSFGLSLNKRTEKFNLFSQLGVGYRELPRDNESINRDLTNNETLFSKGREYRNEKFYNMVLGTDYHIDDLNVLTLSGSFAYEVEDQPSQTNFDFEQSNVVTSQWLRNENTSATNPKWQYELQYKRDYKDDEDHSLLFSALGNFFGKDLSSDFSNATLSGDDRDGRQQTRTDFKEAKYTFKLDYTKPFTEEWTVETGSQYVIQDVSNDYSVTDLLNGVWVTDQGLTNIFEYDQKVLGLYGTVGYEGEKWGVKLGLRLENTNLNTLLATTNETGTQNYTNLFPSGHTSLKLNAKHSLQLGYSRRIYRPRLWDLNPFFNIRNNFSIRTGNPELLPQFTDSYELSNIYDLGQSSFNFSIYHRYTTDVIERVSTFENNVNTTKPVNIGTNKTTGVEINAKVDATDWLTLNGDFNYNYFSRLGTLETTTFDFSADNWSTKLNAKLKLPIKIDFEVTGRYQSGFRTVQGNQSDNLFADFGARKKIIGGRGVINLSVRDVFASRIYERETNQSDFYLYNFSQRGRFITIGFSYGFGKGEAMEYSGRRRR